MFYFKAQEQLTSTNTVSQAEIQEGQIVVGESPPHAGPKRRHKKGGRWWSYYRYKYQHLPTHA